MLSAGVSVSPKVWAWQRVTRDARQQPLCGVRRSMTCGLDSKRVRRRHARAEVVL